MTHASLSEACRAALDAGTAIVTSEFTVTTRRLPKYSNKDFALYPSPAFSWSRYHYRIRGEWFGIVHQLIGNPARIAETPKHLQGGQSAWIDTVEWDSAIKWRISAEDVVAKYRRFPFDNLFDAINQIDGLASIRRSTCGWKPITSSAEGVKRCSISSTACQIVRTRPLDGYSSTKH
jgi:hypothetical protein